MRACDPLKSKFKTKRIWRTLLASYALQQSGNHFIVRRCGGNTLGNAVVQHGEIGGKFRGDARNIVVNLEGVVQDINRVAGEPVMRESHNAVRWLHAGMRRRGARGGARNTRERGWVGVGVGICATKRAP
jgi:hypothetical protein